MKRFKYWAAFGFAPLAAASFYFGGIWTLLLPLIIFGLLPAIEYFLPPDPENMDENEEAEALQSRLYDLTLYSMAPAQFALLIFFLFRMRDGDLGWLETAGAIWTMGICCGIFGINVAHELGHRHRPFEQFLAKALLLTSLYLHFFIEHNRGHHVRIATDDDPASARRGESLYRFWTRSVAGGWLSAWQLEKRRLARRGKWAFSFENQMLRFQLVQATALAAVWWVFGTWPTAAFLMAAAAGFLMLETVNYIEHYGLRRRRLADGRWEKVGVAHSWNSDHPIGRLLLFELTRHSDHHLHASRKYQTLRHLEEGPQMQIGYPAMMTLALIPPLFFRVMHPRIEEWNAQRESSWAAEQPESAAHV